MDLESEFFRCVLLRHDLPDGTHHFDWMFALEEKGIRPLLTWRIEVRPDEIIGEGTRASISRLPDHRSIYLLYEGPISGDRGQVTRVRKGVYRARYRRSPFITEGNKSHQDGETSDGVRSEIEILWNGDRENSTRQIWRIEGDTAELIG